MGKVFARVWKWLESLHTVVWLLQGAAAVYGLVHLVRGLECVAWYWWLALLGLGFAIAVPVVVLVVRARSPRSVVRLDRNTMIATGNKLIRGAKQQVVMFGGDMSWAPDYRDSLYEITSKGKSVLIVYRQSSAARAVANARLLRDAGAELWPLERDLHVRAMLIDPSDPTDALLYMVDRRLRPGAFAVEGGAPGTSEAYEYQGEIYDTRRDAVLVRTMSKFLNAITGLAS